MMMSYNRILSIGDHLLWNELLLDSSVWSMFNHLRVKMYSSKWYFNGLTMALTSTSDFSNLFTADLLFLKNVQIKNELYNRLALEMFQFTIIQLCNTNKK